MRSLGAALLFSFASLLATIVMAVSTGAVRRFQADQPGNGTRPIRQARHSEFSLHPCHVPNLNDEVRCGTYEVYEDRAARVGRMIGLNIVVIPALNPKHAPDPVFWLHGGPGAAATQTAGAAREDFLAGLRHGRDLVFVDQRGTGNSNPLNCDLGDSPNDLKAFFGELLPRGKVRECRDKLEKTANLKLYTTQIAMDDLDEVRAALGYDAINIAAASYGTIAAQAYMRQHPTHVRAVFLLGVATPGIKQPLLFPRAAQHSLDLLFEDCAADPACHTAYPNLRQEFDSVLARFSSGPIIVEMINPSTKQKESVQLFRGSYVERVRLLLYTTTFASFVPFIIHRAYDNNYLPFEAMSINYNPPSILARGMYMTITCSEGIPFISEQDIVRETAGTFVGDYRIRAHIEACKEWPKGDVSQSFIGPVKSNLPVIMISGDLDGSTPPWFAKTALEYLPNGHLLNIRYYGHQTDSPCIWTILNEFIEKGSVEGLDTSCADNIKRPPFAMELPKQFSLQ
jgi:pimeloyl-ACP methyl ester carboxylesterase